MFSGEEMPTLGLIEYADATPEVRAVYDDITATRKTDWINNFWKALANDPATLKRTWADIKQIMAPGALDPLTKELLYVAVSVTNQCGYCIASHTAGARKQGMTDDMFRELMAVVGMANETNRLVAGYQVEIDPQFKT
jgi:AhpD family alkylhydroperoxidase